MSGDEEVDSWEHATEASVSAGRKKQLDQYEPINEQVTLTVEFPEGATPEEKKELVEDASEEAMAEAERGVMARWEQYVREESFGDE